MAEAYNQTIKLLREDVARRIAAGEVIDRPAAVVRELLDNAIDAGATEISCYIEDGGRQSIRVIDNGAGMKKEDLERSVLPHATSKIESLEDLNSLTTLGFRGEALSSIGACARLEITSLAAEENTSAQTIIVEGGKTVSFAESRGNPGTVVEAGGLFFNMPARKKFLKRAQTEGGLCRTIFVEKALANPQITFRFWNDDKLDRFFPAGTLLERVRQAHGDAFYGELFTVETLDAGAYAIEAVLAGPEITHRDRKYMQTFVNRRRIFEYSLLQAVEYGYTGYLPGGLRPVAFVFIRINPELVDFNIHPAKREARFRNLGQIHASIVLLVKDYLSSNFSDRQTIVSMGESQLAPTHTSGPGLFPSPSTSAFQPAMMHRPFQQRLNEPVGSVQPESQFRFIGQIAKTYLAAMTAGELLLIDQHAAHERILFDKLQREPASTQPLAVPMTVQAEPDELSTLESNLPLLAQCGFSVTKTAEDSFEVREVPGLLSGIKEAEVIAFIKNTRGTIDDLKRAVTSLKACRSAVKAGDEIDPLTAAEIVRQALALPDQHCPHGRPVIVRFSAAMLDKLFQRVV